MNSRRLLERDGASARGPLETTVVELQGRPHFHLIEAPPVWLVWREGGRIEGRFESADAAITEALRLAETEHGLVALRADPGLRERALEFDAAIRAPAARAVPTRRRRLFGLLPR